MAPGRHGLSKVQFAKEVTNGTAVNTATALWRGNGGFIEDSRVVEWVEEMTGIFDGADRTHIAKITAGLKLDKTVATFEQLPYLLAMSYGGPVAGTMDGTAASGYVYTTNIPSTTAPTNTSFTVQTGDDVEAETMAYAKCTKWDLTGEEGKAVQLSAELIGQQSQRLSGGLTAGIAVPAVEDILTGMGKVYIDSVSGTAGTTQIANQVIAFKVSSESSWVPRFTMDGQLYWSFAQFTGKKITGEITFLHDNTNVVGASGEKSKWRSQTPRLLQLKFTGSPYATTGTGGIYNTRTLIINLPIKYTKFDTLDENDGTSIIKATFTSRYNATFAGAGSIIVANEVSTLP